MKHINETAFFVHQKPQKGFFTRLGGRKKCSETHFEGTKMAIEGIFHPLNGAFEGKSGVFSWILHNLLG